MSVSLSIEWKDKKEDEIIQVASQEEHDTLWADIAKRNQFGFLGCFLPICVDRVHLPEIIREAKVLRRELLKRMPTEEGVKLTQARMDKLIDGLERLVARDDWVSWCIG